MSTAGGAQRAVGEVLAQDTGHGLDASGAELREAVLDNLRQQGFKLTSDGLLAAVPREKDALRALQSSSVEARRKVAEKALRSRESAFISRLVGGGDLEVDRISPRLRLIDDRRSFDAAVWRWISLHWSIPVSSGYGRRLRFLVTDAGHNDSPIGIIGLADPVFALRDRDAAIGWERSDHFQRLTSIMDAFALGAVPPYSGLLGGKLVALLASSREVRDAFAERYGHRQTIIRGKDPSAELAVVTTSSALGRSSIYNRLRRANGSFGLEPVGYTQGSGDFHFSGAIYARLVERAIVAYPGRTQRHELWSGKSFRNRREVIQLALTSLDLDSRRLRIHGIRRQVYLSDLATNSRAWLSGADSALDWQVESVDQTAEWWLGRWGRPRATRTDDWRSFRPADWVLWGRKRSD